MPGSVPRPCGSKNRISRMIRSVCERPFFGGMKSSTRSVNSSRPTLSLFRIALNARRQATSAASSRFDCVVLPKFPEALTSTTSITVNNLPPSHVTALLPAPAEYQWLAKEPSGILIEYPLRSGSPQEQEIETRQYTLYQQYHGHPL